jgi:hypothetical protein
VLNELVQFSHSTGRGVGIDKWFTNCKGILAHNIAMVKEQRKNKREIPLEFQGRNVLSICCADHMTFDVCSEPKKSLILLSSQDHNPVSSPGSS